jgi:hypothetical protein
MRAVVTTCRVILSLAAVWSVSLVVCAGGAASSRCEPEEMRWTPRQWRDYMCRGQETVRAAYSEAARMEAERRAQATQNVRVIGREKDRFGDPMYVRYGPRAYAGTPDYIGPRYASSFEPVAPACAYESEPRRADPSIYVPTAPARSDTLLKPSAARPY